MKKLLFAFMMVAAVLFLAASCEKDDLTNTKGKACEWPCDSLNCDGNGNHHGCGAGNCDGTGKHQCDSTNCGKHQGNGNCNGTGNKGRHGGK